MRSFQVVKILQKLKDLDVTLDLLAVSIFCKEYILCHNSCYIFFIFFDCLIASAYIFLFRKLESAKP